jgi:hypothetical protein
MVSYLTIFHIHRDTGCFGIFPSSGILEFGNWICFRLQVRQVKVPTLLDSSERANCSHSPTSSPEVPSNCVIYSTIRTLKNLFKVSHIFTCILNACLSHSFRVVRSHWWQCARARTACDWAFGYRLRYGCMWMKFRSVLACIKKGLGIEWSPTHIEPAKY